MSKYIVRVNVDVEVESDSIEKAIEVSDELLRGISSSYYKAAVKFTEVVYVVNENGEEL